MIPVLFQILNHSFNNPLKISLIHHKPGILIHRFGAATCIVGNHRGTTGQGFDIGCRKIIRNLFGVFDWSIPNISRILTY